MSEQGSMANSTPQSLTQDWAGHTLDMAGALLLVIAAVFVVSLVLRHLQNKTNGTGKHLKVLQALSVGTKDRVLLVQVGVEQILLGVGTSGIRHLHTLSESIELTDVQNSENGGSSRSFASTIRAIAGKQQQ